MRTFVKGSWGTRCFSVPVVAWLLGRALAARGLLPRAPLPEELSDRTRPWLWDRHLPRKEEDQLLGLSRSYTSQQGHRGAEVRLDGLAPKGRRGKPQPMDPAMWRWRTVIAVVWRVRGEHINVLEARSLGLALRWRGRCLRMHRKRFVNILDSFVTLAASAKGRPSSRALRPVLAKNAAVQLA